LILRNAPFAPGEAPPSLLTGFSGFDEPVSDQGRVSDQHRQSVADLAHLRRNGGPEITINAVLHAPADPRPPMSVLVRDRVWSEKCQQQSFRHDVRGCRDHRIVGKVPIHDIGRRI
jgi:hypothetical protein